MANTDAVKMAQLQYFGQEFKKEQDKQIETKATKATTLAGYGITDAMTSDEVNTELGKKATKSSTLAGYGITDAMTSEQVQTAISTAVNQSKHLKKTIATAEEIAGYETDPSTADPNMIYLLKDETVTGEDKYKEYTVIGEGDSMTFVCTGSTSIDLSGYVKSEDMSYATNDDVDAAITAIFGTAQATE